MTPMMELAVQTKKMLVTATRRPRLGFLGVGWIGRHRLEAIARSGTAEIVAIVEPQAELAAQAKMLAPGAALGVSFAELLESGIDGLVIATPNAMHADQAACALERGIAVFCQKPLGRNEAETRRVVQAAREANRLLAVDFSYRFISGAGGIRELIQGGDLGHVYAVDLIFHNGYGPDKPWFYDRELSGGGCVIDLGIHLVDLMFWMLDSPRVGQVTSRLFAGGEPLGVNSTKVEDYATAQLDLDTGTVAQLSCSWKLHAGREAIIEASFYGTRGGASLHNRGGSFFDFTAERFNGTAREVISAPQYQNADWGGRAALEWTIALAAGCKFDSECERLIEVARTLDAIYGEERQKDLAAIAELAQRVEMRPLPKAGNRS